MLFKLLKYLQPTHYFQRFRTNGQSVFPIASELPKEVLNQLQPDLGYESDLATQYDLSWQAVQYGYLVDSPTYAVFDPLPLVDEYRFLRKQFHSVWVFYVLALRLFELHAPLKEIASWKASKTNTRATVDQKNIRYPDYDAYDSSLIQVSPLVSVVIPTLNRYTYLHDVLKDFEAQTYTHFEILVVDQSEPFRPEFYQGFDLTIRVIRQEEKALWLARNQSVKAAYGTYIALSEDDVRIPKDWIEQHLKCMDYFKADISAGVFYPEGGHMPKERSFFTLASQFATGNALLHKDVFKLVGLFDRQFEKQRMGDGEFGIRCYLAGLKSVSNPLAFCLDVKAGVGGLRDMGSWDAFRPKHWLAPRPIPSVIYYFRRYFGNQATIYSLLRTVPFSVMPYQLKKSKSMMVLGGLISLLLLPLVLIQVGRSWYLARLKLKEGPKIERLNDE
ncbi:glycosyltransferase family 2 protein [Mangrovimonas sp. ST2L15]|uniref:glycosyltransferase family 2 protein n=1 Tax=Mangrovimonas sp. ST2L15 TaxID=1645916 RepID=UPI0006B5BC91|nr:glycosyltransferase family A protein [Mangrovimonas sp. ST2L15]